MSTGIRKTIFLALVASLVAFSGCGGGGGSSSSDGTTPPAVTSLPAKVLSWEPPTSYVDTTAMNPLTDLDRFEIHVNETGTFTDTDTPLAEVTAVHPSNNNVITTFDLANLAPHVTVGPKYYVSLRAVAITGLKSDFSPTVSFSF